MAEIDFGNVNSNISNSSISTNFSLFQFTGISEIIISIGLVIVLIIIAYRLKVKLKRKKELKDKSSIEAELK